MLKDGIEIARDFLGRDPDDERLTFFEARLVCAMAVDLLSERDADRQANEVLKRALDTVRAERDQLDKDAGALASVPSCRKGLLMDDKPWCEVEAERDRLQAQLDEARDNAAHWNKLAAKRKAGRGRLRAERDDIHQTLGVCVEEREHLRAERDELENLLTLTRDTASKSSTKIVALRAERDAAIKAIAGEGRKRGLAEAERDRLATENARIQSWADTTIEEYGKRLDRLAGVVRGIKDAASDLSSIIDLLNYKNHPVRSGMGKTLEGLRAAIFSPAIPTAEAPEPAPCEACDGDGWFFSHELQKYDGPALETGCDDTRYLPVRSSCDRCNGTGRALSGTPEPCYLRSWPGCGESSECEECEECDETDRGPSGTPDESEEPHND